MNKYVPMFTYVDIITRPGRWWIGSFIVLCWLSHTHTNTNYLYCNNDMDKRCIVVALGKKHRVDCFSAVESIVDHATMLLYADCYTDKKRHFFFCIGAVLTHRTAFVHASSVAIWGRRCIKAYVWTFSTIQFKSNCNAISTADRRGICRPADFAVDNNCVAECWCWSVAVGWSHGAPMPSTILIHQLRDCNERFRAHCLLSMWDCWSVEQSELAARWEMRWRDKRVRWRANSLRRSVRRRTAI